MTGPSDAVQPCGTDDLIASANTADRMHAPDGGRKAADGGVVQHAASCIITLFP